MPGIGGIGIGRAIACGGIGLNPLAAVRSLLAPWQLAEKLVHHRIVLNALHGQAHAFELGRCLTGAVELFYKPVNLAMQPHIAAKVEQHAVEPRMTRKLIGAARPLRH